MMTVLHYPEDFEKQKVIQSVKGSVPSILFQLEFILIVRFNFQSAMASAW